MIGLLLVPVGQERMRNFGSSLIMLIWGHPLRT